jgi:hypothetical protein
MLKFGRRRIPSSAQAMSRLAESDLTSLRALFLTVNGYGRIANPIAYAAVAQSFQDSRIESPQISQPALRR